MTPQIQSQATKLAPPGSVPIDVVYTWVDGNHADYQALYARYARTSEDRNPERYRDLYALLKFSLRSLALYAPWIRHIYLFTCRPHVPAWLHAAHPQIRVVHHDEVFDSFSLPTFNSNVIESYLHGIPDLSEYFLYMNDDFLFGRPTTPGDFFTEDGKVKVFGTLLGERLKFRVYDEKFQLVSTGFIEHAPILIYKPAWQAMLKEKAWEVQRTRTHRFRHADDVRMDRLYRYFMLAKLPAMARAVPFYELLKIHRFHKITNHLRQQQRGFQTLEKKRPKFYCLNDDQGNRPNERVNALVRAFLHSSYPAPSPFER